MIWHYFLKMLQACFQFSLSCSTVVALRLVQAKLRNRELEVLLNAKASVLVVAPKVTFSVHQWARKKKTGLGGASFRAFGFGRSGVGSLRYIVCGNQPRRLRRITKPEGLM